MARSRLEVAAWVAAAALLGGCRVEIPEGAVFSCAEDADCGGEGYVCAPHPSGVTACCQPQAEVCNGEDDDCDGVKDDGVAPVPCYSGPAGTQGVGRCVGGQRHCLGGAPSDLCSGEVLPVAERCNQIDDDCDGSTDEDFDLNADRANCGACGNACGPADQCRGGQCVPSGETRCDDGIDEDLDQLTDCADPECDGRSCGSGCLCGDGARHETTCAGGADEDGDALTDCADPDCLSQACGAPGSTLTCDAQSSCSCAGVVDPPPEAACADGQDQDCDGAVDCADPDCEGSSCGAGCSCSNGAPREVLCDDMADNDADGKVDCADRTDCPQSTPCKFLQGGTIRNGTCQGNGTCK